MKIQKNSNEVNLEFEENILSNNIAFENLLKLLDRIDNHNLVTGVAIQPESGCLNDINYGLDYKEHASVKNFERFPNNVGQIDGIFIKDTENVVDLNKIKIQRPKIIKKFRCPNCGQAHFVRVIDENGSNLIVRDLDSDVLYKIKDNINFKIYKYGDTLEAEYDVVITNSDGVKGECPICQSIYPIGSFMMAYDYPSQYGFEYDYICELCGSEMAYSISEDQTQDKLTCEKCGYTKEVGEN